MLVMGKTKVMLKYQLNSLESIKLIFKDVFEGISQEVGARLMTQKGHMVTCIGYILPAHEYFHENMIVAVVCASRESYAAIVLRFCVKSDHVSKNYFCLRTQYFRNK